MLSENVELNSTSFELNSTFPNSDGLMESPMPLVSWEMVACAFVDSVVVRCGSYSWSLEILN